MHMQAWHAPILALAVTSGAALAAERSLPDVEVYLDQIAADGASGVALVQLGEEPVLRRGFGSSDCKGETPIGPDHLVMIGSITKEFTQILAYQLVEEGKLAFDDPIGKFLPNWPADRSRIPVESVVMHTSGLPDLVDENGSPVPYAVEFDYIPVTRAEMLERAALTKLIFEPGAREEYSNLGYGVLGAVLEIASGKSYEDLLEQKILGPAGMRHTGYTFPNWQDLPFADGCRRGGKRWGSPLVDGMWGDEGPSWNLKAAGGLFSTVDDLARWLGALGSGKLFGPKMQKKYFDERLVESKRVGHRVMGPAGSNGIFNSVAYWVEDDDLRVAVITTRSDFQAEGSGVARQLIRGAFSLVESPMR